MYLIEEAQMTFLTRIGPATVGEVAVLAAAGDAVRAANYQALANGLEI
jgi:hypothetical protein